MNQLFISKEQRKKLITASFDEWPAADKDALLAHIEEKTYTDDGVYVKIKKGDQLVSLKWEFDGEDNTYDDMMKALKKFKKDNDL